MMDHDDVTQAIASNQRPDKVESVSNLVLVVFLSALVAGSFAQQGAAPAADVLRTQPAKDPGLVFEVATIKPAGPSPDGHTHINYPSGGGFSAQNITILTLMQWAYGMPERQILDGPAWLSATRFDLEAKTSPEGDAALRAMPSEQEAKRRMVQVLLADRFNLKVHTETRVLPAYDLVPARGGSKLQASQANGKTIGVGRTHFYGTGLTLTLIAEQLSQLSGRIVVDRTNLSGTYDLALKWSSDDAPATDDSAPSLFTAIEEQLGLRLESAKEPVAVLVIDHIQPASAN